MSKFMEQSKVSHLENTKKILKYLTTTINNFKVFVKETVDYGVLLGDRGKRKSVA